MPKKKLFDSARDYLERMHATRAKDVPSILKQGLKPMPSPLDGQSDPSVFMTAGRRGFSVYGEDGECIYNCR